VLDKKRILFMAASCGEAHLYNCMQLGNALNTEGHTTAFIIGSTQRQIAKDLGINEIYEVLDICYLAESEWGLFETITERDYIERCLSDEKEVIEEFRPDLIISDFRLTTGISAYIHNIPWVSMLAQLWYLPGYRFLLQDVFERSGLDTISAESIDLRFQQLAKKLNWLIEKIKMTEITDLMQLHISPFCTLLRTIPVFVGGCLLPENFRIVGPFFPREIEKQPTNEVGIQLRRHNMNIEPHRKTIILRLSGLIIDKSGAEKWVKKVKQLFTSTEFQLIVVGDSSRKTICGEDNVIVSSFIPFELVFQLDSIALVSNGGLNTTSQAIAWEVPHLVIPTQVENEYNAFIVKELGVGDVLFPPFETSPEVAFEKINNLFNDKSYKLSLNKTKKYFDEFLGVPTAIECLKKQQLI